MVTFEHVHKEYRRGYSIVRALDDVCVQIREGVFCAIMGPSGSGKSTFLNLIAGLDTLTSGKIFLDGKSTQGFTDRDWTRIRRELLGMVFQSFHLVQGLTAAENVALPLRLKGVASSEVQEKVARSLEVVGMEPRAGHRPHELSGGEQQRVAIARALVHNPRLILADEPTGNLDSTNAAEVVALLRRVSGRYGQTVILATHSEAAAEVADFRYVLQDGKVKPPDVIHVRS